MLLCAIAIRADTAPTLAWILFWLNAVGAALVGLALWIGEPPEDRKPFGPFTDVAEFLDFLDERTPQGRLVAWPRERGLFEYSAGSCRALTFDHPRPVARVRSPEAVVGGASPLPRQRP
jgi:hypothetical protein